MYTTLRSQVVHIGSFTYLDPSLIVRLEADRNYTYVYLVNAKKLLLARTLKAVLQTLEPYSTFVRINRHEAVNLRYIRIFRQDGAVILHDNTCLIPSRRRLRTVVGLLSDSQVPLAS